MGTLRRPLMHPARRTSTNSSRSLPFEGIGCSVCVVSVGCLAYTPHEIRSRPADIASSDQGHEAICYYHLDLAF